MTASRHPPFSFRTRSLRSTTQTADIIAENGITFISDYMNDEQPYLVHTDSGPIACTPYSVEVNDFTFFHRRGTSPAISMAAPGAGAAHR